MTAKESNIESNVVDTVESKSLEIWYAYYFENKTHVDYRIRSNIEPPITSDLSLMSITGESVQEILSKAQELRMSERLRPQRKWKIGVIIRRQGWMLCGENNCSWHIPRFGSEFFRKQKRNLFFYPHDFESLWISMFIFNFLIISLYYGINIFWPVNSTFLSQLIFFILNIYFNF